MWSLRVVVSAGHCMYAGMSPLRRGIEGYIKAGPLVQAKKASIIGILDSVTEEDDRE